MSTFQQAGDTSTAQQARSPLVSLPRLLVSRRWRWMTLGVVVLAVVLARLGFWQLDRRAAKQARNALLEQRTALPPIELRGQPLDIDANEYRRVVVAGEYDAAGEVALRNRSREGLPGVHVLTPLRIDGSDSAVIVDRGWLPIADAGQDARAQFAVSGPVRVEGVIRRAQPHTSPLTPADTVPPGGRLDQWLRPDMATLATQLSYPILPYYVELIPAVPSQALPYAEPALEATDEGPHLGYAMQWFSFMVILLVGYAALILTHSRNAKDEE